MPKYLVRFTTKDGDYDKEWCTASNKDEARDTIMHEHWNIQSIDSVERM